MTARKTPPCPVEGCRETRHHWHSKIREGAGAFTCSAHRACEVGSPFGTRCYGAAWRVTVDREKSGKWAARLWNAQGLLHGQIFDTHAEALAWALRQVGL